MATWPQHTAVPSSGRCLLTASITFSRGVAFNASSIVSLTAANGLLSQDVFLASNVASYGPSWWYLLPVEASSLSITSGVGRCFFFKCGARFARLLSRLMMSRGRLLLSPGKRSPRELVRGRFPFDPLLLELEPTVLLRRGTSSAYAVKASFR